MEEFANGFFFTAGGITAFLCIFAVAALCEFVAKLAQNDGRDEIRNAIVDNAASICLLAEKMRNRRDE